MQQQWQPRCRLKNRPYEILQVLGEGGFGITYKAKNLGLDIPVVIKTPNSKLQRDANYAKYVANFNREAKQLAKLGMNPHPHIVRVFDFFAEDNLPCIVMDYVPGTSLYDLVQMNGALSESQALEYIKQIGSALVVCHKAGIIHRDVHPNNILIHQHSGRAVLIDFGISGTTQTSRNTHSGNRAFAPWEQVAYWEQQNSKTPQVDIYTLAASFYYLVTGDTPRECLARKYNNAQLSEPKQLNSSLSEAVNQGILKGMAVLPENRPNSVQAWLELLEADSKNVYTSPQQNQEKPKKSILMQVFEFETVKFKEKKVSTGFLGLGKKQTEVVLHRERKQAKYFTEDLGNGITLEMVEIPGGTFIMGSPEEEKGRHNNEKPQHEVTVPSFYMGKFAVTQVQWQQVAALPQVERKLKPEPSKFKGNDLPVEQVSWYDVVEFCARLSQATGKKYRLTSEAEWEYACRAGTTTPFYFGKTITTDLANYNGNYTYANEPKGKYRQETTRVGSFPPNTFGLYDMHGNVWEWCADTWHDNYQGAPIDGSAWIIGGTDKLSPTRGGSWGDNPIVCRSACRIIIRRRDGIYDNVGFRVVSESGRTF